MAEILIRAIDSPTHPDIDKDRAGRYKRGMPVVVMPDGHSWGKKEGPPIFIVLKIPGVSVEKVKKYIEPEMDKNNPGEVYRRRLWNLALNEIPQAVIDKLSQKGELIIKAVADYNGPYDYTWIQVRSYLKQISTGESETVEL